MVDRSILFCSNTFFVRCALKNILLLYCYRNNITKLSSVPLIPVWQQFWSKINHKGINTVCDVIFKFHSASELKWKVGCILYVHWLSTCVYVCVCVLLSWTDAQGHNAWMKRKKGHEKGETCSISLSTLALPFTQSLLQTHTHRHTQ